LWGRQEPGQLPNLLLTGTEVKDSPLMREVFDLMDLDATGELDFREYIIGRAFASKYLSNEQTLRLAFDAFDTSGARIQNTSDNRHVAPTARSL